MPRPWYIDGFGEHYLELYAHRSEREAGMSLSLLEASGESLRGQRLLDLCCGGGRHLKSLARRGAIAVGLDLSPDILRAARKATGPRQPLVRGDMRRLPFADAAFDGVLSMFSSFGYFRADEENWGVFEEIARVLRPGGFFLFDFLNRGQVARDLVPESERRAGKLSAIERRRIEGGRVLKRVTIRDAESGAELLDYEESVRLFAPEEIRARLRECGLIERNVWGGYGGAPFDPETSARLIILTRKNPI